MPFNGNNSTTKLNNFNNSFNEYLAYLMQADSFRIKFRNPDKESYQETIISGINDNIYLNSTNSDKDQFDYSFIYDKKSDAGILKIPSFAVQDINTYISDMDSIFNFLVSQKTGNLIIDLRNNAGGHPIFAAQLLSYLTNDEFIYFKENKNVKEFSPLYQSMKPDKKNFSGQIYVIINGGSLSTTGHFISLVKYNTNAIFVGEEPGSTFYCNDFSKLFILPASEIQLNLPRESFTTAVKGFTRDQQFKVDYRVSKKLESILNSDDDEINFIRTLLIKNTNL